MQIKRKFVIETLLPDGYHWFSGFMLHPEALAKNVKIPGAMFSPYISDIKFYESFGNANADFNNLSEKNGAKVVPVKDSHIVDGLADPVKA